MEIEAPYLQAIQAIAGKTPGEKQKTINRIARRLAQAERFGGQSVDSETQIPDIPEPLKPVVRVEVAKILHQYDVIIDALKSEDMNVVSRALHAKWFFDGSDTSVVNAQYFLENVFPEISLYARLRIVKNFATYLRNTAVAADFFLTLTQRYGVSQAIPLLVACTEDFAFKMIIENKIILSIRMVESLYRKYPNLVMKYLMLSKPADDNVRNIHRINIHDYEKFLSEVARDHFEDFMDICHTHDWLQVKLGKTATKNFFKTRLNLLVEKPTHYIKLVSLKMLTHKLSVAAFKKMFKNLFPAEKDAFSYSTMNSYLQYYEPEREKIHLILDTFREVYGKDLLSFKHLIDSDLLKVLPEDDRVEQAKLKLEDDKVWHDYHWEPSWRCYLSTCDSIPVITKAIAECSDSCRRGLLLLQLVYTCKVNEDKDAFLKVLNYIYDRHRNEKRYNFYCCLWMITESFDLGTLSSNHWEVLNKYIKFTQMRDNRSDWDSTTSELIGAGLHYCLLNGLPLDDYLHMFVDTKMHLRYDSWNILTKHPDFERKILDLCITVVTEQYPIDHKIWNNCVGDILLSLTSSLWDFNERNKVSNGKFKKLSVKDYPWLRERIKNYILVGSGESECTKVHLTKLIRKNERDLYFMLLRDIKEFWAFGEDVIFDVLKQQPQRVLDHWEECLKKIQSTVDYDQHASWFLTKSQWYQDLPINIFKESLKTYNDPKLRVSAIRILAILADGKTFEKIIESFVPSDEKLNVDHPDAKNIYLTSLAIATDFRKVNPPVSLDIIAKFCVGDYLHMATRSLTSVCRRIPVVNIIPFATMLTRRRVSVMKHGIRLIYLVAPLEDIRSHFTALWNSKGHTSIRHVLFTKIYDLFCKQPDSRNWRMIQTCVDSLKINDDEKIFERLSGLSAVPSRYLYKYIKLVLNVMKAMEQQSDDPGLYIDVSCQLIANIDGPITHILPEEYCQDLIKKYLFVFDYNSDIFTAGMNLTIYSYLLSFKEYNESRFKFFGDFFRRSVKEHWDKSHPKYFNLYPINFMTSKFFASICSITERHDSRIFEAFLEIFQSALQPHQDAASYLDLVYSIAYNKSQTSVEFGKTIAETIPELIEVFSSECVISMSNRLSSFVSCRTFSDTKNSEETLMSIIEILANGGTIHCAFFAANMLSNNTSTRFKQRHKTVAHALRNFHNAGISWFLNERLAASEFCPENNG